MRLAQMTTRRWMFAVAAVAVVLAAGTEIQRMEQRQHEHAIEAEIQQMAQALNGFHIKYGYWPGCRGSFPIEIDRQRGQGSMRKRLVNDRPPGRADSP